MTQFFTHCKRLFRNEDGNFLILGAGALFALLAIIGGAVDMARYININSKFKDAGDTALLAAASSARSQDVDEVALKFFKANFPKEYMNSLILKEIDVEEDRENLEWTATISGQVKTRFAGFVGFDTIDIDHRVTVAWDISKRLEAIFTIDTSASMCMDVVRSEKDNGAYVMRYKPDYRCKKLNAMKEAMHYVIDNGMSTIDGMGGPAFYAGIIPFNHLVKLPNPNNVPQALVRSEATLPKGNPKYFSQFGNAEPLSSVIPLMALKSDGDKARLKALVNNIKQSPMGRGWTRSNIGVLTAALMLDPAHHGAFNGAKPSAFDPNNTDKVVVMMTDGANVGCCFAAHPEGDFSNQYLYLYKADNAHLTGLAKYPEIRKWKKQYNIPENGLCQQMKDQGITIYSVVYDVDDRDAGGKDIKDAYRGCASSEQFFFDVQSEEDLRLAYKTIAQSFLRLRIIY